MNTAQGAAVCGYLQIVKRYWPQLSTAQQSDLARDVDLNYVDDRTTSQDIYDVTLKTKLSSVCLIERIGSRWEKLGLRIRRDLANRCSRLACDQSIAIGELAVYCDSESFARLISLRDLWPKVIAAQQANIVNAALVSAMSAPISDKPKHVIEFSFESASRERFIALAKHWGNLRNREQQAALDTAELVAG